MKSKVGYGKIRSSKISWPYGRLWQKFGQVYRCTPFFQIRTPTVYNFTWTLLKLFETFYCTFQPRFPDTPPFWSTPRRPTPWEGLAPSKKWLEPSPFWLPIRHPSSQGKHSPLTVEEASCARDKTKRKFKSSWFDGIFKIRGFERITLIVPFSCD